jgi:hypothetical protein
MNTSVLISARITAAAKRRSHRIVGPFVVNLHPANASAGWNYAVPVDGAEPTEREIADLVAHFVENDRLPRLELIVKAAPAVAPALAAAGFREDNRLAQLAAAMDVASHRLVTAPQPGPNGAGPRSPATRWSGNRARMTRARSTLAPASTSSCNATHARHASLSTWALAAMDITSPIRPDRTSHACNRAWISCMASSQVSRSPRA